MADTPGPIRISRILTPAYFVIGCYHALRRTPPNKSGLADFVRTHHPSVLKKLEQERRAFEFQQVQALTWLGEDTSMFNNKVRALDRTTSLSQAV
jgi:hypothetical protein